MNDILTNKLYLEICSKKHMLKYQKEIKYLKYLCKIERIPNKLETIMISILLIETYYRYFAIRIVEYIVVFISSILNLILNVPIKNYTVGIFQVGISYALNYDGFKMYEHVKYIKSINFRMLISILSSFYYKRNIHISFYRILGYYKKINLLLDDRLISRRIGEMYNGSYEYGILVQNIEHELKNPVNIEVQNGLKR